MRARAIFLAAFMVSAAAVPAAASGVVTGVAQPGMPRPDIYKHGMQIVVTGSGSALPDPVRGGASVAVIVDGKVLQFDMGRGALENGMKAGLVETDIDYLFFTHLHFDHIASFSYYMISNWIAGRQAPVQVMGPKGTVAMVEGFRQANAGNIDFAQRVYANWAPDAPGRIRPDAPYVTRDIDAGIVATGPNFTVRAMRTIHYTYPGETQQSLAYRVDSLYGSVVISGDVGPMAEMAAFAKDADFLFHEVQRPDPGMISGGKMSKPSFTGSGASHRALPHSAPSEVGQIAADAHVKTLVAYHLPPYTSGDAAVRLAAPYTGPFPGFQIWGDYTRAMAAKFSGRIVIAEDAMVFDLGARTTSH